MSGIDKPHISIQKQINCTRWNMNLSLDVITKSDHRLEQESLMITYRLLRLWFPKCKSNSCYRTWRVFDKIVFKDLTSVYLISIIIQIDIRVKYFRKDWLEKEKAYSFEWQAINHITKELFGIIWNRRITRSADVWDCLCFLCHRQIERIVNSSLVVQRTPLKWNWKSLSLSTKTYSNVIKRVLRQVK